ncbi:MAG: hypothetical protein JNM40_18060 [Myxococcales bacterium]|nr:hypothetical protein [Myxococcales bacterium]
MCTRRLSLSKVWVAAFGIAVAVPSLASAAGGDPGKAAQPDAATPTKAASPASASPATSGAATSPVTPVDPKLALSEQRSSVSQVQALRKTSADKGDKVKELCLYERLRGLQQTLESTQVAVAALEAATARGDQAAEKAERERLSRALELSRQLRTDAEGCVGGELVTGSRATSITVTGGGQGDDPKAGPAELQTIRPVRLELPSRPNPASAFRPAR